MELHRRIFKFKKSWQTRNNLAKDLEKVGELLVLLSVIEYKWDQ
jgi:hypothetical protein